MCLSLWRARALPPVIHQSSTMLSTNCAHNGVYIQGVHVTRDVNVILTVFRTCRSSRTAARYSNPCALQLSWTAISTRAGLHRLAASWSTPVVCIQMLSITQPRISSGGAAIRCRVEPNLDLGRIRVMCRATRRRIHQRTAASGTTTVTRARTMPPDSSWLQMRAFPVTSWRRWAYGRRWPW
jgi:hypothetical protein